MKYVRTSHDDKGYLTFFTPYTTSIYIQVKGLQPQNEYVAGFYAEQGAAS